MKDIILTPYAPILVESTRSIGYSFEAALSDIIDNSIGKGAKDIQLQHKEYLHTQNTHPGLHLLQRLQEDIGNQGTILVWYEKFEKSRNRELGEMFPEYADFMQSVNDRVIDLMVPFFEGWFVDKDFFGSASIKKVLPVLVSELSYKELNIQEGASAQRIWMETILDGKNLDTKNKIITDLIEYCKLDTLAMVQLYKVLQVEILVNNL